MVEIAQVSEELSIEGAFNLMLLVDPVRSIVTPEDIENIYYDAVGEDSDKICEWTMKCVAENDGLLTSNDIRHKAMESFVNNLHVYDALYYMIFAGRLRIVDREGDHFYEVIKWNGVDKFDAFKAAQQRFDEDNELMRATHVRKLQSYLSNHKITLNV
jgi:hypothetical protein